VLPGARAEDEAPLRHVVQLHDAVGDRDDARTKANPLGAFGSGRDIHLGRGDDLDTAGVVLAIEDLVEAELVQQLRELEPAPQVRRRVPGRVVERADERAEAQLPVFCHPLLHS